MAMIALLVLVLVGLGFVLPVVAVIVAVHAKRATDSADSRMESLTLRLLSLRKRVENIESAGATPRGGLADNPEKKTTVSPVFETVAKKAAAAINPKERVPTPSAPPSPPRPSSSHSSDQRRSPGSSASWPLTELFVGRKLMGCLGIGFFLLGIAFGLTYAYRQGWLCVTPSIRVSAAVGIGAAMIGSGAWWRGSKRIRFFALLLLGGGIATLYLAGFAGYQIYGLYGRETAGMWLGAVAALGLILSLTADSQLIAFIGTLGAFIMPLLLKTAAPNHLFFIAYTLGVNIPVVMLGLKKDWSKLYNASLAMVFLLALVWSCRYWHISMDKFIGLAMMFWIGLAAEAALLAAFRAGRPKINQTPLSTAFELGRLILSLAALMAVAAILPVDAGWTKNETAKLFIIIGAVGALPTWLAWWRGGWKAPETTALFCAALAFISLAVPIARDGAIVTAFWGFESVALSFTAARSGKRVFNILSALLAVLTLGQGLAYGFEPDIFRMSLFLNQAFLVVLLGAALVHVRCFIPVWFKFGGAGAKCGAILPAAGLCALALYAVNAYFYFNVHEYAAHTAAAGVIGLMLWWRWLAAQSAAAEIVGSDAIEKLSSMIPMAMIMTIVLTAQFKANLPPSPWWHTLWLAESGLLLLALPNFRLRPVAEAVALTAAFKSVCFLGRFICPFHMAEAPPLFLNSATAASVTCIVITIFLAVWHPGKESLTSNRRKFDGVVSLSALTLAIALVWSELDRIDILPGVSSGWASMSVTIFLTVAGVGLCALGLWRRLPWLRLYSFAVMSVGALRLLMALWDLKDPARIFAFVASGIGLLALSLLYHQAAGGIHRRESGND